MTDREELVERCSRLAHEVNRAYCLSHGDESHVGWYSAPEWQRNSARVGVVAILDNPSLTPEQSHEGWLILKGAEGWIFGEVKDEKAKTHPCFRSYKSLPAQQRMKDYLFGLVVRGIADLDLATGMDSPDN